MGGERIVPLEKETLQRMKKLGDPSFEGEVDLCVSRDCRGRLVLGH